jgi:hypothetical protein
VLLRLFAVLAKRAPSSAFHTMRGLDFLPGGAFRIVVVDVPVGWRVLKAIRVVRGYSGHTCSRFSLGLPADTGLFSSNVSSYGDGRVGRHPRSLRGLSCAAPSCASPLMLSAARADTRAATLWSTRDGESSHLTCSLMHPAWHFTRSSRVFVWVFVYKPNTQTNTLLPAHSRSLALHLARGRGSPPLRFASTRGPPSSTQHITDVQGEAMCRAGAGASGQQQAEGRM